METRNIQTSWGAITLTLDDGIVTRCSLPPLDHTPRTPFTIDTFQTLDDFLNSFRPTETPTGTEFQQAVWNAMQTIPRGATRTYGEIAETIGHPRALRAVGSACGANPLPLFIPCHRVVAKNSLGGFGSGLPWKKMLLTTEGAL